MRWLLLASASSVIDFGRNLDAAEEEEAMGFSDQFDRLFSVRIPKGVLDDTSLSIPCMLMVEMKASWRRKPKEICFCPPLYQTTNLLLWFSMASTIWRPDQESPGMDPSRGCALEHLEGVNSISMHPDGF